MKSVTRAYAAARAQNAMAFATLKRCAAEMLIVVGEKSALIAFVPALALSVKTDVMEVGIAAIPANAPSGKPALSIAVPDCV